MSNGANFHTTTNFGKIWFYPYDAYVGIFININGGRAETQVHHPTKNTIEYYEFVCMTNTIFICVANLLK